MCAEFHTDDIMLHLKDAARQVDAGMQGLLESMEIAPDIRPAVVYTLQSPGKRIRSVLVLWCCELISGRTTPEAQKAAAAVEMVHTYSLVHDDLPAMDNDDLRRGRPTCHKAFDEATAILTGDALLTMAFEVLAERIAPPPLSVALIRELAQAAGPDGIIGGQLADLRAEDRGGDLEALQYIHIHKTAKMFRCATVMGALCGQADPGQQRALADFGLSLGLVFQITDDILDVSGSSGQLGKTAGKDQKAGKLTYPAVVGMDRSRQIARDLTHQAIESLAAFGPKADRLRCLATTLLDRNR
jgi:geranylgeranyl diphosphate synthase, type II